MKDQKAIIIFDFFFNSEGDLFSFFVAFGMMMNPIRMMNDINIRLNQAAGAADRIFEIMDWKTRLHSPENPVRLKSFEQEIRFEQMGFYYPDAPERKVLQGINFTIPKRRAIALVGASGSGKSSLVSLLPRIFDVTEGRILIDGQDIRSVDLDDLRSLIAVVSQDVFLFNDTIEENIRCGRLHATSEEVREAARRANALEFIEATPAGFKSVIGDRGQKLSGGERQRISIARAFLRNAPILILDEATSSLDSQSEKVVQAALDELMAGRTTFVIAHRLSTIQKANRIIVLSEGQIVEEGTHDELLERRGPYQHLYSIQFAQPTA
jgi:subfamily B ATP-binding cassette protein MsbA